MRSGVIWTQQAELVASDGVAGDQFGSAVAVCGDAANLTALIGANWRSETGCSPGPGAAYVFTCSTESGISRPSSRPATVPAGTISAPSPSMATRPWWERPAPPPATCWSRSGLCLHGLRLSLDPAGQTHRSRRCRRRRVRQLSRPRRAHGRPCRCALSHSRPDSGRRRLRLHVRRRDLEQDGRAFPSRRPWRRVGSSVAVDDSTNTALMGRPTTRLNWSTRVAPTSIGARARPGSSSARRWRPATAPPAPTSVPRSRSPAALP